MLALTSRQGAILAFVRSFSAKRGYPPTIREIGKAFAIASPNGVVNQLRALERKRVIARDQRTSRGLRVLV